MQAGFLPALPPEAHPLLLFGVLLLAGVAGGELARRLARLPRITGYVLTGLALGPGGLGMLHAGLIAEAWIFVEIALGLVLFALGRRLQVRWLATERYVLATGLLESALAFLAIFVALWLWDVSPLHAALAAAIGVSSSPAVVMLVARETQAEGQLTERALHLVAINSVLAFMLIAMLLPWTHREYQAGWFTVVLQPLYMLAGSLLLAAVACGLGLAAAHALGKSAERQLVMLLGLVVLTVGAAHVLKLPVLLALLVLGVLLGTLDRRHAVMTVDLWPTSQIFVVVLFVVIGASLQPALFAAGAALGGVFLLARFVGKSLGVLLVVPFSGTRRGTAGLLCLTLTPMSGLALALVHETRILYPDLGAEIAGILMFAVLVLELAGPVAVQFALRASGEAGATKSG